jgi:hypothetical protein
MSGGTNKEPMGYTDAWNHIPVRAKETNVTSVSSSSPAMFPCDHALLVLSLALFNRRV